MKKVIYFILFLFVYSSIKNTVVAAPVATITNSFGGSIEVKGTDTGYAIIYGFPSGGPNMCVKMLNQGWYEKIGSTLAAVKVGNDGVSWASYTPEVSSSFDLPLDMESIDSICSAFSDTDDFYFMLAINDDSIT